MRSLLGHFLSINGTLMMAPSLLVSFYFPALLVFRAPALNFDPPGLWVAAACVLALAVTSIIGHLMILFGQTMSDPEIPAFPSPRPHLWFILKSTRYLATAILWGICAGLVFLILGKTFSPRFMGFPSLMAVLLALSIKALNRRIKHLENLPVDPVSTG